MDKPEKALLIFGASARGAAQSARRAGFSPWAADRFADLDLQTCGAAVRVEAFPDDFLQHSRHGPPGPWMYTGPLENHPELLARLAEQRLLWGNPADVVRRVRDPFLLEGALRSEGFSVPRVVRLGAAPSSRGRWLQKTSGNAAQPTVFLQEWIEGRPIAAIYCADGQRSAWLGATTQLVGDDGSGRWWCTRPWTGAGPLRYAGSVWPAGLSTELEERLAVIGAFLTREFGLRGLFGIDAVATESDVYPVEVNPRYTASVEILERAGGVRTIAMHAAACTNSKTKLFQHPASAHPAVPLSEQASARAKPSGLFVGKAVVFAEQDAIVSEEFARWVRQQNERQKWPRVADIPARAAAIRAGQPIATVFATGRCEQEAAAGLQHMAGQLRATLASD